MSVPLPTPGRGSIVESEGVRNHLVVRALSMIANISVRNTKRDYAALSLA